MHRNLECQVHESRQIGSGQTGDGKLYTVIKKKLGADCGSDHELLITKFRLKLKKVGKTARPFRYDLNQIPYDYTVEVRNRFKGLDLIDRAPDELWTWIMGKATEFQKNIYFCFIDYAKAFDCVDYNKLENSERDGNPRPPDLPPEKSVCRSGSNS